MSDKRALCVGINEFANIPRSNWLYGCVNDANDMAGLLKSKYGFGPRDVTVLTDAKATKAAVMAKLESMVGLAKKGSVKHIVFTYSSHGTQVPDTSGDEPDKADEAFVAYDLRQDGDNWDLSTLIVDDELHDLFIDIPAGVLVEVYLDTCHSGTGLKAFDLIPGRQPKYIPPPTPVGLDDIVKRSVSPFAKSKAFRRKRGMFATPVLFAACSAAQTSSDATFNKRSNGAFTYFLLKEAKKRPSTPRAELLKAVKADLKADRFDQVPQLEGDPAAKATKLGS
jgi:hypothetical protein